jgi:hypothetical protein
MNLEFLQCYKLQYIAYPHPNSRTALADAVGLVFMVRSIFFGSTGGDRRRAPSVHTAQLHHAPCTSIGAIPTLIKSHHLCFPCVTFLSTSQKRPLGHFCEVDKGHKTKTQILKSSIELQHPTAAATTWPSPASIIDHIIIDCIDLVVMAPLWIKLATR